MGFKTAIVAPFKSGFKAESALKRFFIAVSNLISCVKLSTVSTTGTAVVSAILPFRRPVFFDCEKEEL